MPKHLKKWLKKPWVNLVVIVALLVAHYYSKDIDAWSKNNQAEDNKTTNTAREDLARLQQAYTQKQSSVWLKQGIGFTVVKILPDDRKGSAHQRFIVSHPQLANTLLIAHNIDLAPYIPINVGSYVTISGRYEWNNKGGVIHWTHRDPKGHRSGGWIDFKAKRYQ